MPCFYCGVRLRKGGSAMRTKDHVVPKSKGGRKTVEACIKCNGAKADMSLEEFRRLRGGGEFFGEMKARIEAEKTAWTYEFDAGKQTIVPLPVQLPRYMATFDLSNLPKINRNAKTKKERKERREWTEGVQTPCDPPDLWGVKFGTLTVKRRIVGKWEVECICGAIEHRSSKAVLNPANTFDACVECRKPIGKLRTAIFKETGVEVSWEDCFWYIYGGGDEKPLDIPAEGQ